MSAATMREVDCDARRQSSFRPARIGLLLDWGLASCLGSHSGWKEGWTLACEVG